MKMLILYYSMYGHIHAMAQAAAKAASEVPGVDVALRQVPETLSAEAIAKMERALSQFVVQGIQTSIPLHQAIFADAGFRAGEFDTKFMERFLAKRAEAKQD